MNTAIDRNQAIESGARYLQHCQEQEAKWKAERLKAEGELLPYVDVKPEGSATTVVKHAKITTTSRLTRKVDAKKFEALREQLSLGTQKRICRAKYEVNKKELDRLKEDSPDEYGIFSECLTVAPAKTAIKVEIVEADV